MRTLQVHWLGTIDYQFAWEYQRKVALQRREGLIADTLLLLEHPPVITLGRAAHAEHLLVSPEHLAEMGIHLVETDRGGDITYHGPGQLVGYPILDLREHGRDVHRYLRRLEEVLILAIEEFGIAAHQKEGLTGVWVGEEKVAAIGVKVSHWVTMHGFALNVHPNLNHFDVIVPCGIHGKKVTSLQSLLCRKVTVEETIQPVTESFKRVFGYDHAELPAATAALHSAKPG